MTGATPPLPQDDSTPPSPPSGPPAGIAGMMGTPRPTSQPSPDARENAKDTVNQVVLQLKKLAADAKVIANQYPEFAENAKAIDEACTAGQTKIVGSLLRGLEGPPPPTAAI